MPFTDSSRPNSAANPGPSLPAARLMVDEAVCFLRRDGSIVPATFQRESPAFDEIGGSVIARDVALTVDTPLGRAVRLYAGSANLLDAALSQGQSDQGLTTRGQLSLTTDAGITGPGTICWVPREAGDALEVTIPTVNAPDHIPGMQVGIFLALCFSAYIKTDIRLTFEMSNPKDPEYTHATPQFVEPNPQAWQRGSVAVRVISEDLCVLRIVAHDTGTVILDGLQLDPRPFPVWMIEMREPMLNGWYGPWTPGGTHRAPDSLSVPLQPGDFINEGTVALWFKPDWPGYNFSHSLFEVATDVLGMTFTDTRFVGAAGGAQVWPQDGTGFSSMVRIERNRWHHAALSWDAQGHVALYLDGECYGRNVAPDGNQLDASRLTGPLCLGMPSDPVGLQGIASHPSRLDGTLADFRLYHQSLDDGAVAALAMAGRAKLDAPFITPPDRLVSLLPDAPQVLQENAYFCWFPNNLAQLPDGHFETASHFGPDYGPVLTEYWKRPDQTGIHHVKANADAPWVLGKGSVLRPPIRLADGRWLAIDLKRNIVVSTDGNNWEVIETKLHGVPENAAVGTNIHKFDPWYVDSNGRLLGLGWMSFQAKTDREETMQERLFGGVGGKRSHLFLATPVGDDITQLKILSFITEGQDAPFGAYCEETTFIETAPGEFLVVGRVSGHNLPCIQLRSTDNGLTWSKIEACPFGAVFPRLTKLPNGVVFCHTGRPEATVHWTADGGRTWSAPTTMLDSREMPVQSMNLFYGATTGYGCLIPAGPDRLFETHDALGHYDPVRMLRSNQCCFTDIHVQTIDDYAARISARADTRQFTFAGGWQSDTALGDAGDSVWTQDAAATATLSFDGTGIVLIHPLLRHGGMLTASIDGKPVKQVSLYDALPHHRFTRTLIADGLPAGRHTLTLTADLSGSARHAHGNGDALAGINSWKYLMHTTGQRWCAISAAEILG